MALDNPNTVDAVGIDPESGHAVLVIQDQMDWSDPAAPLMVAIKDTAGSATATAISNGRVYVADGAGGLVVFK